MATVKLKTLLIKNTGVSSYETSARTVGEVLDELKMKHGDSIEKYLEGCLVIVDGKNVEFGKGLKTKIKPGSEVSIIPKVAGG